MRRLTNVRSSEGRWEGLSPKMTANSAAKRQPISTPATEPTRVPVQARRQCGVGAAGIARPFRSRVSQPGLEGRKTGIPASGRSGKPTLPEFRVPHPRSRRLPSLPALAPGRAGRARAARKQCGTSTTPSGQPQRSRPEGHSSLAICHRATVGLPMLEADSPARRPDRTGSGLARAASSGSPNGSVRMATRAVLRRGGQRPGYAPVSPLHLPRRQN